MMHSLIDHRSESAKEWLHIGSHEAELNRIETALVGATKCGSEPPSSSRIFGALIDASIVCAEVLDVYGDRPIPLRVRIGLSRLHCANTDLVASLKTYAALSLKGR